MMVFTLKFFWKEDKLKNIKAQ